MMADERERSRPPEMVAATEERIRLIGDPVSVSLGVPESLDSTISLAHGADPEARIYLTIDDLEAEHTPGVVYGVYLDLPADATEATRHSYHVGNIAPFGIEHLTDRDRDHAGEGGFRHIFDVTDRVRALEEQDLWDPASFTVTFEIIPPMPPPGQEAMAEEIIAEQRAMAAADPLTVGRVSLHVV